MTGLVSEIQRDALDPNVRVTGLLRKVKFAAGKLQLEDAIEWVDHELSGYRDVKINDLPPYRRGHGTLMRTDRFGRHVATGDATSVAVFSQVFLHEPVSSIEALAASSGNVATIGLPVEFQQLLNQNGPDSNALFEVDFSITILLSVIDRVRDLVLDWAMNLERQGISGEGMSFSMEEKERASTSSITIHGNVTSLHSGDISGHQNRVVIDSIDASQNQVEIETVFENLRTAIDDQIEAEEDRTALLAAVDRLRETQQTPGYAGAYQNFIERAAPHVTVIAPFLPALGQLFGS